MEEKIKKIMAEIFVCSEDEINKNTSKDDIDGWDSLQHLIFVSKLEEDFKASFTPEEINSMVDLQTIIEILKDKK